jgi:hypothetical protein
VSAEEEEKVLSVTINHRTGRSGEQGTVFEGGLTEGGVIGDIIKNAARPSQCHRVENSEGSGSVDIVERVWVPGWCAGLRWVAFHDGEN